MKIATKTVLLIISLCFVTFILILYGIGVFLVKSCYKIDECEYCYDVINDTAKHNAAVDVLLCACQKARANDYENNSLNNEIIEMYKSITGNTGSTKDICEGRKPLMKYK